MTATDTTPAPTGVERLLDDIPELAPLDAHNRKLASNVHPHDWINPEPAERYNLVVIGAGTAGLVTAIGAAGLGAKVALVERKLMGGDCLNVGCVPSKALIRAARAAADVRDAREFGVNVPDGVTIDFPKIMERMRRLRADISPHDSAQRFADQGIDVFIGNGVFESDDTVAVGDKKLKFTKAVIATGARAAELTTPGLAEAGYLTNETVFSLTELPKRLGVIGAGPIGCELAQAFARFGSEVYLVESEHSIMTREDPDAAAIVEQHMTERDGIKLLCCGKNLTVRAESDGKHLEVDSHGTHYDVVVDEILVGVGRAPNVEGLGLDKVNVQFDTKRGIEVDDKLRTTNKRIFACGDVASKYKFTHTADALARIVIQNSLFPFKPGARASALTIPWCTYTDPEVAHVGMYAEDAKAAGIETDEFRVDLSGLDRAILDGETEGFIKVLTKKGKDQIVGATIVARHAGEMISEVTLAMVAGVGLGTIANTIHPYPTQAEVIKRAGDAYNRTRLTPFVASLFKKIMAWQR